MEVDLMTERRRVRGVKAVPILAFALALTGCTVQGMSHRPADTRAAPVVLRARDQVIHHKLDTFFRRLALRRMFSGAVLLQHGPQVVYRNAFGYADREKKLRNHITTRFNLGS